jgi:hypothetical protein
MPPTLSLRGPKLTRHDQCSNINFTHTILLGINPPDHMRIDDVEITIFFDVNRHVEEI